MSKPPYHPDSIGAAVMKRLTKTICAWMLICGVACADITSNLDSRWALQDNAATTTIVAAVGTNATLSTGTTAGISTTGPGGSIPLALAFSGVNSTGPYITCGTANVSANGPSTVALWFKASAQSSDSGSTLRPLFYQNATDNASAALIRAGDADAGKLRVNWYNSPGLATTSATYVDSTWRHLAVTRSGTTVTTYINGVSVSLSVTGANGASLATFYIAGEVGNAARRFAGSLADVRIYSRALSSSDILELVALGSSSVKPSIQYYYQRSSN